ncbi:polyketide synthase [Trichoderma atroviride IMI 206040]|uniref:Polyketide synthase n=1 Tax=Hypocrea atroviridis (strain ATCC 20476 / IMI 206040) TaxID=452589 RepID=G9P2F8_HYPAI|nr:polyketide synthase [Trichoderma atroviride IMI 206040]EHK42694.1 polyketide synthase [Trichoderma atroviride IMI 206040]
MASSNGDAPSKAPMPLAIVGMSCRLSGGVSTLDDFWTMLSRSRDGWRPIPEERYSAKAYYHPDPHKKGCFNQKGGYFMTGDMSTFDAPFFNITRQEAEAMDPQQRHLLECTYEALENAGIPKHDIAGSNMGVFIGGTASNYHLGTLKEVDQIPMYDATGNHQSIQAGRISYYFNLHGPSFTADTACSSGLYALHLAVQSIRSGDSDSAIVAASSLHLQPHYMISMSGLGLFNEHGKTFAFDHRANSGFARGEGTGCLILKPLHKALADNDKIYSVIVNTGVNQDGKTSGLTYPSGDAQEQLMRDVYARAGISPQDTGYVEAHGTGTRAGDPIEANSVHRVFGDGRTKRAPLYMGSVKSNVGHLENASGIISIIKASMMLDRGFVLPNVNFEKANEAIPLDEWNIKVPTSIRPWPRNKRFISVNSFGFGGSNAHAVLERVPTALADLPQDNQNTTPRLFVLSAHDESAAKRKAENLGIYIEQHPEVFQKRLVNDMAYTLGERRTHLQWRIAIAASSCSELANALNSISATPGVVASKEPKVAFVYTGQGAQWAEMGKELMESHPIFARAVETCSNHLQSIGAEFSLLEELAKSSKETLVNEAHISQPACTAIQIGLTKLLNAWGVSPSAVVGHSSGEIGAAFAAGAITLEDAMSVAYWRGKVSSEMKVKHPDLRGAMLAVGAKAEDIRVIIKTLGLKRVGVACENSPNSITASGDEEDVDRLAAELESRSIFNRKLRVAMAYHSAHMQLVADDYKAAIKYVTSKSSSNAEFYSSLFGNKIGSTSLLDPSYWVENLTKPVLFSSAFKELYLGTEPDIVIEIGPHSALEGPIKQILKTISPQVALGVKYLPSLVRKQHATSSILNCAGSLFVKGHPINLREINRPNKGVRAPTLVADFHPYGWSEHKYWFEPRSAKQMRQKPFGRHDLLGLLEDSYSDVEPRWKNVISTDDVPWVKDHRMQSLATFPLAGYICMAVEAASQRAQLRGIPTAQIESFRLREVQVSKALILDDGVPYETVFSLKPYAEGTRSYSSEWDEFQILSWNSARGWLEHCRGLVGIKKMAPANPVNSALLQAASTRRQHIKVMDRHRVSIDDFYSELEARGAGYSGVFKISPDADLRLGEKYTTASLTIPDTAATMPLSYETASIAPSAFIDLFFQLTFPILGAGSGKMPSLFMPSAVKEIDISSALPNKPGDRVQVVVNGYLDFEAPGPVDFFIDSWHQDSTTPVVKMSGFRVTPVNGDIVESISPRSICYKVEWEPLDKRDKKPTKEDIKNGATKNGHKSKNSDSANDGFNDVDFIVISHHNENHQLERALLDLLALRTAKTPRLVALSDVVPEPTACYICLSEIDKPIFANMGAKIFDKLQNLFTVCHSMLWVTSGAYRFAESPENNIAQGFLRTVRSEANKAVASLDLDPHSKLDARDTAELILRAIKVSVSTAEDDAPINYEFAEEGGKLMVPRIVKQDDMNLAIFHDTETSNSPPYLQPFDQAGRRLTVAVGTYGALDSLYWKDEREMALGPEEVEIKVACTGMNFKDVVIAMGQVSSPYLGVECSGTISRIGSRVNSLRVGDRVCAMSLGAYGTYSRCLASSAAVIPSDMSFVVAASIPVVYCTAYYGIVDLARLEYGEKILIHAASGGVGQAAIQLAQMVGADIYATVGSADKKQFIMDKYGIPESRIFYSRDTAFGPALREATGGCGVDVVLNSLAGDLLRETWNCLAPFGRFIELGKRDITNNTRLEMAKLEYNCTFSSVDLTLVAAQRPKILERAFASVMRLLESKTIRPIEPITSVSIQDVEGALRKLQSGKTVGKLVVTHGGYCQVRATHPPPRSDMLERDATYIIIGGTGGLGRSITRRMVRRGARHIVLLSRGGKMTNDVNKLMKESRKLGASIYVVPCDVANEKNVLELVEQLEDDLPPIRGIIHAAMVLRDVLFEKMTFEDYEAVVQSKISGAWNFHKALMKTRLQFFIVLSSVAGIVGNRGQAHYSAANTYLDALVQYRRRHGLTAASIDLAAVEGVGYLAENGAKMSQVMRNLSDNTLGEAEVLALIESAMTGKVDAFCQGQVITGLGFDNASSMPFYASDAKFSHLREALLAASAGAEVSSGSESLSISQQLRRCKAVEEAQDIVTLGLRDKLGAILMLSEEVMAARQGNTSITAFGLDSLNAIELRNWIGKELQAHLQVLELLTSGRVADLAGLVLRKSRIEGVWTKK